MTNNEKFNAVLNGCENPRAVYDALLAFAEAGKERISMSVPITFPTTLETFIAYQEQLVRRKLTAAEREATAEWLDIFNDISTGNLDSTVAMERINYLIDHTEDPARLRFLRAAREWIIYAWKGAQ